MSDRNILWNFFGLFNEKQIAVLCAQDRLLVIFNGFPSTFYLCNQRREKQILWKGFTMMVGGRKYPKNFFRSNKEFLLLYI